MTGISLLSRGRARPAVGSAFSTRTHQDVVSQFTTVEKFVGSLRHTPANRATSPEQVRISHQELPGMGATFAGRVALGLASALGIQLEDRDSLLATPLEKGTLSGAATFGDDDKLRSLDMTAEAAHQVDSMKWSDAERMVMTTTREGSRQYRLEEHPNGEGALIHVHNVTQAPGGELMMTTEAFTKEE